MIKSKPLNALELASDFKSPTGTLFTKGSIVAINSNFQTQTLGDFDFIKPNPVYLYLKLADELIHKRKDLIKNPVTIDMPFIGPADKKPEIQYEQNFIEDFFQKTVGSIILLFSGLEAFVNQQIPGTVQYQKKRTSDVLNHEDVQRRIGTQEKMAKVLTQELKKDVRTQKALWKNFLQFKDVRDELVHLKMPHTKIYVNTYDKLFQDLVDIDLEKYFKTVVDIINFYQPNFIESK